MEIEGELDTLDQLKTHVQLITESEDAYCTRSIECKLQERYGEDMVKIYISIGCVGDVMRSVYSTLRSTLSMTCGTRIKGETPIMKVRE